MWAHSVWHWYVMDCVMLLIMNSVAFRWALIELLRLMENCSLGLSNDSCPRAVGRLVNLVFE